MMITSVRACLEKMMVIRNGCRLVVWTAKALQGSYYMAATL